MACSLCTLLYISYYFWDPQRARKPEGLLCFLRVDSIPRLINYLHNKPFFKGWSPQLMEQFLHFSLLANLYFQMLPGPNSLAIFILFCATGEKVWICISAQEKCTAIWERQQQPSLTFFLWFWMSNHGALIFILKSAQKGCLSPCTHFLPVPVLLITEIALSVIVGENKPFTALFLFSLFPGKPTGSSSWVWNDA